MDADTAAEVALTRRLVAARSISGRETPAAEVLVAAFRQEGFDEAYVDPAGNAVGVLRCGGGEGRTVMLNGHIDTVPLGDESAWPHPPLSGDLADGRLWGRGACDMKAALACMVYAAKDAQEGLEGTVVITGVVQEEVGGPVLSMSGVSREGLTEVLRALWQKIEPTRKPKVEKTTTWQP